MVTEFRIVGGYLEMPKSTFTRELLGKDSKLRALLNWKAASDFSLAHPGIVQLSSGLIRIDFNSAPVSVGESPKELLGVLKARYREKLKGRVYCRAMLYTFGLDLGSDDESIEYLME